MKPLVLYHNNCADGFGAAFAAWRQLGAEAEYVPMDYGGTYHPTDWIDLIGDRDVYILDFSLPRPVMELTIAHAMRVIWLDHHKTAFEMWVENPPERVHCPFTGREQAWLRNDAPLGHVIHLDNNRSGAMLAWEYFHPNEPVPALIRHIDDRDRWQFKIPGTKEVNAGLRSLEPWSFEQWSILADDHAVAQLATSGSAILRAHDQNVQAALKQARACEIRVPLADGDAGYVGLACNAPPSIASDLGHELANTSGTFGLVWSVDAGMQVRCSLRSNGEYDVSAIAKAFGGGGHRNAAGFATTLGRLIGWLA